MREIIGALVLLLVACTGPRGPVGADGKRGADGADGKQGLDGKDGLQGERGERGDAADAGTTYEPVTWIACSTLLDLVGGAADLTQQDGIEETGLNYAMTVFTNSDVLVTCDGALGSAESTGDAHYFPAQTNGGMIGACSVSIDFPPYNASPGTVGFWEFTTEGAGPSATYHDPDPGHPLDGYSHAYTEDECSVLRADADMTWHPVKIADVFK